MITEIITTGTEILLGEIDNENSRWLSELLNRFGYTVAWQTTVGDNFDRLCSAMDTALHRADLVITTGGLGSTQGDLTKSAGASVLGVPYCLNREESDRLRAMYEKNGRVYSKALERQAWFGENARLLPNEAGTASGCILEKHGKILIHLPGPPFEMKQMASNQMIPCLIEKNGPQGMILSRVLSVQGLSESETERRIMDRMQKQSNPTLALYARPGFIALRITARAESEDKAEELIEKEAALIKDRLPLGDYHMESGIRDALTKILIGRSLSVSAAESCTGGLIGKLMTDLPGSSSYFMGSAVTYQNSAKESILGVSPDIIRHFTAVSSETAAQMAEGSRRIYGSDVAVSTTGYAGPGTGERGEAPGLVYIGVSGAFGTVVHEERFMGSRKSVRYAAAEKAMYWVWRYIRSHSTEEV
jgi:nicotinamide-nucleotide amidase